MASYPSPPQAGADTYRSCSQTFVVTECAILLQLKRTASLCPSVRGLPCVLPLEPLHLHVLSGMDSSSAIYRRLAVLLLLLCVAIERAAADAIVTGAVFCDQCRDGQRSFFDYPLCGARVAVACAGGDGQVVVYKEGTTNWFGTYGLRFDGIDDLSHCYAQVVGGSDGCGAGAGPARGLNLLFRMFGVEMYTVDALLALPPEPMFFCPKSTSPLPAPPAGLGAGVIRHPPTAPEAQTTPPIVWPLPPSPPSLQASTCPYEKWAMPEFSCYWKVVGPETTVVLAFGPLAAQKYGPNMTLRQGLQGRGDTYRTLLREATAALLNSYNNFLFVYPTLSVVDHMNSALLGTPRHALVVALRFHRANSGAAGRYGDVHCNFTPCN